MKTHYKIHPAIGVARVGNSEQYYVGPECSGGLPTYPPGRSSGKPVSTRGLRDSKGKMKRQAARFQVYRYDDAAPNGAPVVWGQDDVVDIKWTAHLANKKASWYEFLTNAGEYGYGPDHPLRNPDVTDRPRLMIDAGPRTVCKGQRAAEFRNVPRGYKGGFPHTRGFKPPKPKGPSALDITSLGEVSVSNQGELFVLGGYGISGRVSTGNAAITEYANNDGWFDDTSDGPVTATIELKDGTTIDAESAWVLVGPPAYAPEIENIVTLYDTIFDGAVRQQGLRTDIFDNGLWNDDYKPHFDTEIRPFLERPEKYKWVTAIPPHPHHLDLERLGNPDPSYNGYRQYYLDHIRPPSQGNTYSSSQGAPLMPFLAGDNALKPGYFGSNYLTVTRTQYFVLLQWAAGTFIGAEEPNPRPLTPGEAIDKGVLDNCVGGAFSPGIEMTWVSRDANIFAKPFRITPRRVESSEGLHPGLDTSRGLEPGDVTRYMAVPWQADFNECSVQPITNPQNPDSERWLWWWPPQRPEIVRRSGQPTDQVAWVGQKQNAAALDYITFPDDVEMVEHWSELGFIISRKNASGEVVGYYEYARTLPET